MRHRQTMDFSGVQFKAHPYWKEKNLISSSDLVALFHVIWALNGVSAGLFLYLLSMSQVLSLNIRKRLPVSVSSSTTFNISQRLPIHCMALLVIPAHRKKKKTLDQGNLSIYVCESIDC